MKKFAQVKIDKEQFEKLCAMQCTRSEVMAFFDVSKDTLIRWCKENYDGKDFETVLNEKRDKGKISIRRAQWQKAIKETNTSMLIWLGKQYLGQTEKVEAEQTEKIVVVSDVTPDANID